jgi:hypothetical protein
LKNVMTREDQQSLVQQYLAALRAGADFRDRKVRRLRAAIRAGAFENRLKLEVASDRLALELMGGDNASRSHASDPDPGAGIPHTPRQSNAR